MQAIVVTHIHEVFRLTAHNNTRLKRGKITCEEPGTRHHESGKRIQSCITRYELRAPGAGPLGRQQVPLVPVVPSVPLDAVHKPATPAVPAEYVPVWCLVGLSAAFQVLPTDVLSSLVPNPTVSSVSVQTNNQPKRGSLGRLCDLIHLFDISQPLHHLRLSSASQLVPRFSLAGRMNSISTQHGQW